MVPVNMDRGNPEPEEEEEVLTHQVTVLGEPIAPSPRPDFLDEVPKKIDSDKFEN